MNRVNEEHLLKALVGSRCGVIRFAWEPVAHPADPPVSLFGCQTCLPASLATQLPPQNAGGAGLDRKEAVLAAIGEAAERYASAAAYLLHRSDLVSASWEELGETAVHPGEFALYHPRQTNRRGFPFAPFTERTRVRWTRVTEAIHGKERWYPAALVYLPYPLGEREVPIAPQVSTGLSCHSSPPVSLIRGLCEVVERDAFVIAWRNRLSPPHFSLEGRSNLRLRKAIREFYSLPDLRVHLLNLTPDSGLPVVAAILLDSRGPRLFNLGAACHPVAERAALKALLEAAQGRPYVRTLIERDAAWNPGSRFSNVRDFADHARLYTSRPALVRKIRFFWKNESASNAVDLATEEKEATWKSCVRAVHRTGARVYVKHLTPPDLADVGLYINRILIPSYQPIGAGNPFYGGKRILSARRVFPFAGRDRSPDEFFQMPHPYP